jgi:hypothetical protein
MNACQIDEKVRMPTKKKTGMIGADPMRDRTVLLQKWHTFPAKSHQPRVSIVAVPPDDHINWH